MIKHIVMWKLKGAFDGTPKAENAARMKRELEGLQEKLPFVGKIEVGLNIERSAAAYDVVLYSEFATPEDLQRYQDAPEHKAVSDFISTVRKDRVVVDYEV